MKTSEDRKRECYVIDVLGRLQFGTRTVVFYDLTNPVKQPNCKVFWRAKFRLLAKRTQFQQAFVVNCYVQLLNLVWKWFSICWSDPRTNYSGLIIVNIQEIFRLVNKNTVTLLSSTLESSGWRLKNNSTVMQAACNLHYALVYHLFYRIFLLSFSNGRVPRDRHHNLHDRLPDDRPKLCLHESTIRSNDLPSDASGLLVRRKVHRVYVTLHIAVCILNFHSKVGIWIKMAQSEWCLGCRLRPHCSDIIHAVALIRSRARLPCRDLLLAALLMHGCNTITIE